MFTVYMCTGVELIAVEGGLLEPSDLGIVEAVVEEQHDAAPTHSRNSSNTSQLSKGSGYGSLSQHSRQSSSSDSCHIRYLSLACLRILTKISCKMFIYLPVKYL